VKAGDQIFYLAAIVVSQVNFTDYAAENFGSETNKSVKRRKI
jgi:hypothetical protein